MLDDKEYGRRAISDASKPDSWEIWPAPRSAEVVYQAFPEFTCLCPRSSYPDFATLHLLTVPDQKVLEMKSLKLWLNSFRERKIGHEDATEEILRTYVQEIEPHYSFLLMEYSPRGNLTTFPMKEYRRTRPAAEATEDPDLAAAMGTAEVTRQAIISQALGRVAS